MYICYSDKYEAVQVNTFDSKDTTFIINRDRVEIQIEGEYHGPLLYFVEFDLCDLLFMVELWKECYGRKP